MRVAPAIELTESEFHIPKAWSRARKPPARLMKRAGIIRFAALKSPEEREGYLRHESGDNWEKLNLLDSGRFVHKASVIRAVPVVLTADFYHRRDSAVDAKWAEVQMEMQSRLARLLRNSKHVVV